MIEQYFRTKYSHLIFTRHNYFPKPYEAIYFKKWIVTELPDANILGEEELLEMRSKSKELYGSNPDFESAELKTFNIKDLYFYQDEIGLTGPKHTNSEEPVKIYTFNGKAVLENGYHRLSIKVINGDSVIAGRIINLDV